MATVGAYDALIKDQLVNRMFGMRLYELTDRPVRPFLAAQAQRSPWCEATRRLLPPPQSPGRIRSRRRGCWRPRSSARDDSGSPTEELEAAKRDVMNRYAEAAAERETSDSSSLADELGRHFLTDEPVPGIAWEYERVRQIVPVSHARGRQRPRAHGAVGARQPAVRHGRGAGGAGRDGVRPACRGDRGAEGRYHALSGVKIDTRSCSRSPGPGRLVSETNDTALGTTTLAYANGVSVVLKPTVFQDR